MSNARCPVCSSLGKDKTGDHLWLMRDGVTKACLKPYHPPYYERDGEVCDAPKKGGEMELDDIKRLPYYGNPDRLISAETHKHFKIRTELSEATGIPVAIYYPETHLGKFIGYKKRLLPKKFSSIGDQKGKIPDLSGLHCCPMSGRKLLITGGEEDMCAAYEMLKTRYPEVEPAVVSLPRGEESSLATVTESLEFFKGFEEIIIATDMDAAGRAAVAKYAPVIGEKARVLVISEKDASDMLVKGKQKEFINAYFNAREYRPSNIISVGDILDDTIKPVPWGLSYPFERLTKLTYGLKEEEGEIIGIGGAPGGGKSTLVRQIQQHLMFVHNKQIAVFDIEEKAKGALKHLIGGIMNKPIHKPDCIYDVEEARRVGGLLDGKVQFYDGLTEDWEEVKDNIRYFASKGIRIFFIDPLSALVEHLSASEANQSLGLVMRDMRRFRVEQGLTFFHANHLNNPPSGKDHGAGGEVYGSQFSGSRAQWKYSTALWGLSRDQLADTLEERNKCKLSIIKDRLGGNTGHIPLRYNKETGVLEEEFCDDEF